MLNKFTLIVTIYTLLCYYSGISQNSSNKNLTNKSTIKNSVLSNGTWYKFSIDTTGVYKITPSFLQNLGINVNELNPKNIRIFGNGGNLLPMINNEFRYDGLQENAILIEDGNDGKFNDNDFVLFYAKGPHSWKIDPINREQTKHINNIYSDKAYYFITVDNGIGKQITTASEITTTPETTITSFDDFEVYEKDEVNLFSNGQQWFGKNLSYETNTSVKFNFENIDNSKDILIRARGVAQSYANSNMSINVNNTNVGAISFSPLSSSYSLKLASVDEGIFPVKVNNDIINVDILFNNNGNPSAKAYLDYIEIIGFKKLIANGKQFSFRNFNTTKFSSNSVVEYSIENTANIDYVFNVTDHLNPVLITNQSGTTNYTFKDYAGNLKEYIVTNKNDYYTPEITENAPIKNQNLHALQNIDYVIVTKEYLVAQAERLANYHRTNANLTVQVITLDQIYNEFSSGSQDVTAIRDFVRHLYINASSDENRIKYLCLFGDGSFDFKDRINGNNNVVPSFQSFESFDLSLAYVTDDYFGMMDPEDGTLKTSDSQEVATGRYTVTTAQEAKEAVDKTLSYYSTDAFGDWRNKITVVADDPDAPGEFVLQETVEKIADDIADNKPEFNIVKIYSDAFVQETSAGGERYPKVNEAINNSLESGSLIVNYFGHGGVDGWSGERILEVPQIQNWRNKNKLPLLITITCEFSKFDNPLRPTAGEFVFSNKNGGAVGLITTTREIFISVGQRYNKVLIEKLLGFNGENFSIAEALMATKNDPNSPRTDQRLFVFFLGDPAMKLSLPKPNIKLTKMNNTQVSQSLDTIKALSKVTLEGVITDNSDAILNNFNGKLEATVFDKSSNKNTLDNDNYGKVLTFDTRESKIFTGQASIKNGTFKLEFIAPKDIRIAYGKSKISLYANNSAIDKVGFTKDIVIGGINKNAPEDKTGPTIQLFMNDESFTEGGNTDQSPFLIAKLQDDSGINTSVTAVDHDIIAILDGDEANPIVLNDFYKTDLDDFTKGTVKYPFRNLETGKHTIKFKCWDSYNNFSESTLNFVVVSDKNLVLDNVLNYPNPMINYTEFWFTHNKPNEPLEIQIQIFTVSGKLIKTINQTSLSEGNLSRTVSWNGLDDFGNKIGKGVYVYKLSVNSTLSNAKASKLEKLVILQ